MEGRASGIFWLPMALRAAMPRDIWSITGPPSVVLYGVAPPFGCSKMREPRFIALGASGDNNILDDFGSGFVGGGDNALYISMI